MSGAEPHGATLPGATVSDARMVPSAMSDLDPVVATHVRTRTVYVGEDDLSGLIYFPSYYLYMSEGDQELFQRLGHAVWDHIPEGQAGPAVHTECQYLRPVHAGDRLTQTVQLMLGRRSSLTTVHEFADAAGALVARGRLVRAWVDLATMRSIPLPDWLRELRTGA